MSNLKSRFEWRNTTAWDLLVRKTQGIRQTQDSVLSILRDFYDSVLVFHGARPRDIKPYYEGGLQLANHNHLTEAARKIFVSSEFPEISNAEFNEALSRMSGIDNGVSFVCLDDRVLLQNCGHYLIYGSEHICGIAAQLSLNVGKDYRQVLKRFGIPTIFSLSLPFALIEESDMQELADEIREWIPRVRAGRKPYKIDFTFELRKSVPGIQIIGHYHPTKIRDPLLPMQPIYSYLMKAA